MTIYFTSDLHFSHINIIKYASRPYESVQEMNEILVKNFNSVVGPYDTCYVLGDVCMGRLDESVPFVSKLNGKKILIKGNHDRVAIKRPEFKDCFEEVFDYKELNHGGERIIMSHFPIAVWNDCSRGSYMLCGHSHGTYSPALPTTYDAGKILDVGVDVHGYRPISFDEVKSIMDKKSFIKQDHHG